MVKSHASVLMRMLNILKKTAKTLILAEGTVSAKYEAVLGAVKKKLLVTVRIQDLVI